MDYYYATKEAKRYAVATPVNFEMGLETRLANLHLYLVALSAPSWLLEDIAEAMRVAYDLNQPVGSAFHVEGHRRAVLDWNLLHANVFQIARQWLGI